MMKIICQEVADALKKTGIGKKIMASSLANIILIS